MGSHQRLDDFENRKSAVIAQKEQKEKKSHMRLKISMIFALTFLFQFLFPAQEFKSKVSFIYFNRLDASVGIEKITWPSRPNRWSNMIQSRFRETDLRA